MKKGRFLWSAHRITERQKAGKARNIKGKQLKNSRNTVSSLHIAVVYALLSNYPGASYIANANTEELAETLCTASKGRYTKSKTAEIQVAAGVSIALPLPRTNSCAFTMLALRSA